MERRNEILLDELGRLEAKIDELRDFVYGGAEDHAPMDMRLIELETFKRQTKLVLYGENPTDDRGLVNAVKNRRVVAIAFVVGTFFSAATAIDMLFGDSIRRHFRERGQRAPIVMAPEDQGRPWR